MPTTGYHNAQGLQRDWGVVGWRDSGLHPSIMGPHAAGRGAFTRANPTPATLRPAIFALRRPICGTMLVLNCLTCRSAGWAIIWRMWLGATKLLRRSNPNMLTSGMQYTGRKVDISFCAPACMRAGDGALRAPQFLGAPKLVTLQR